MKACYLNQFSDGSCEELAYAQYYYEGSSDTFKKPVKDVHRGPGKITYNNNPAVLAENLLADENIAQRYTIFKSRMNKVLKFNDGPPDDPAECKT